MESHIFNPTQKRFEPKNKNCLFCKTGSNNSNMEDNCFYSVYNVKDRTNLVVFRNVKFNEIKIGIPRCESCRKIHSTARIATHIVLFVGIPLVFVIPVYLSVVYDLGTIGIIFLLAATFGLVYFSMVGIEKAIFSSKNIISEKDGALKEPLVKDFLRSGWSIDRPRA